MFINLINITCRLCLLQKGKLTLLTDDIQKKVKSALEMDLSNRSHWPQNICQDCIEYLGQITKYKESVEQNQDILLKALGEVEIKAEPQEEKHNEETIIKPEVDCSIKDEERIEDNNKETSTRKSTRKRPQITDKVPLKPEKPTKIKKIVKAPVIIKKVTKPYTKFKTIDSTILSFMPLSCDVCNEEGFESVPDFRIHLQTVHKELKKRFWIRCGLCKKTYSKKSAYYQHILFHLNPEQIKCDLCGKCFQHKISLELHHSNVHLDTNQKEFQCKLCTFRCGLKKQLVTHMRKHIPEEERPLGCDSCDRRFLNMSVLKEHIRFKHSETKDLSCVCEICAKVYSTVGSLKTHIENHHTEGQKPTEKCPLCFKLFLNQNKLKKHIQRVHSDSGTAKCDQCDHVSPNEYALRSHKKRNHNPLAKQFSCRFCEKLSKNRKLLREHEATHTGESLYTCKFCSQEFKSNANKYKHQKERHPQEWAEWRKQQYNLASE